ncbi:putative esterase [compost metagenome]
MLVIDCSKISADICSTKLRNPNTMKYFITVIVLLYSWALRAQEQFVIQSKYLQKRDTVLVFKPKTYNKDTKYPLVYLLHGYSENYRQWSHTADLQQMADQYDFIVVTPDGYTSFYLNSPLKNEMQYDDFFFKELRPTIHQAYNIDRNNIFISGLSMGGYGALRLFTLHEDYFNTAGCSSGALKIDFNIFQNVSQHFWKNNRLVDDTKTLLGGTDNNYINWNAYSILEIIRKRPNFKRNFIFDCGTEDILYPASMELKQLVDNIGIPATFISRPGDHNTAYWNSAIAYHFVYFKQHIK